MESFVERKMGESKQRILVDWSDEQVKDRLDQVLVENEMGFFKTLDIV